MHHYIGRTGFALGIALLVSTSTFAQNATAPSAPPLPRWDAGGGVGLLLVRSGEFSAPCVCGNTHWEQTPEYRFDLGRYWTDHIKTSVSVGLSPAFDDYQTQILQIDGVNRFIGNRRTARVTTVAPAVTYQFLDNSYMHPYVSGGVRIALVNEHVFRDTGPYPSSPVRYPLPPLEERRTVVLSRPFIAGGAKSYVNEQTFVRTELLVAFGPEIVPQVSMHLGIGMDF